jgi:RimJ/RimL family protein N-acetyltransferase
VTEQRRPPEIVETDSFYFYLRRQRVDDAPGIAAAVADSLAELGKWMPWAGSPAAEAEAQRRRLEGVVPNWERDLEYVYVLSRPGEDRVLGCVGLHRRSVSSALEVGYWLRTDETGRGTMTEAVRALADVALALDGIDRVEIRCDEANQKSAAIPRRLGFLLARTEDVEVKAPGEVGRSMVWVLD